MNNKANKTSFKKGHGRLRSDESYQKAGRKISLSKTGKKRGATPDSVKLKISNSLKGRKITWSDTISRVKAGENYGLSLSERYVKKLEKKAGRPKPNTCEVCSRQGKIYFDHCHKTGKFRGWLCVKCNNTLGLVNDNPIILLALAEYVRYHAS